MSIVRILCGGRLARTLLTTLTLWGLVLGLVALPAATARADGADPLELLLTHDDAGADATLTSETQGEDGQSRWARRRWERDPASEEGISHSNNRDPKETARSRGTTSSYQTSGPLVLENVVYVARDLAAAQQIYQSEVGKLPTFPEATDQMSGPFPFEMTRIGDESAAMSGCNDCMAKDEIFVHRRTVVRKGLAVSVVYTYGNDKVITEDLATWFAGQAASHIPDNLAAASGPAPSGQQASAPAEDASSAPADGPQPAEARGEPAPAQTQVVQARPKDLAIRIDEAGKNAEKKDEQDGSDERGDWYEVRYERPRTFAGYRSGAVTVYNRVVVARDGATAEQIYQEQVKLNEKFPEAKEKVGDPFELKDGDEIGDESRGLSACNTSCNSKKEIYLHKRIVARVENVVSVVYVWGLANEEGVTDANARYFASLVAKRARG